MELKIDKKFIDEAVQKAVEELKQNNIWIPKGMTNGEVIEALFPKCVERIGDGYDDEYILTTIDGWSEFTSEWWNAPYKKGGE